MKSKILAWPKEHRRKNVIIEQIRKECERYWKQYRTRLRYYDQNKREWKDETKCKHSKSMYTKICDQLDKNEPQEMAPIQSDC